MAEPAWVDIASDEEEPDWMILGRQFRECRAKLILHVPRWLSYTPLHELDWQKIKYRSDDLPPKVRGVYAFVLDVVSASTTNRFPPMSTVLYVGETGDESKETLRSRLQNYRNIKAQMNRPKVYSMLYHWGDHLDFYYAEVSTGTSTKAFETALLDALLPPKNKKDFSAIVRKARDYAFD